MSGNSPNDSAGSRGEKRSGPVGGNEGSKRRAPYTLRACDACRRRKGRCNGDNPCSYCSGRSLNCSYTFPADDKRIPDRKPIEPLDQSSISSLSQLVINIQGQLATLTAQVQASANAPAMPSATNAAQVDALFRSPVHDPSTLKHDESPILTGAKQPAKRFYGPTSPDYSFNVAESKSSNRKGSRGRLPSIGEDGSDEEEMLSPDHVSTPGSLGQQVANISMSGICHFSTLLTRAEVIKHIEVYKNGIGELHPVYSVEKLLQDVDAVYEWKYPKRPMTRSPSALPDELRLLILNVAICIALSAEGPPYATHGKTIFAACESFINSKLVSLTTSVHQVTLALLVGIYHFSLGRYPLATRLCGISGRLAMELGLHNQNVSQQYPDEDQDELAAICCSLIVLDRQWNAASGLPPNFQYSDFELATKYVKAPYLKAMIDFTLMSHTFNEPIDKAAKGESVPDSDSAFDFTNYRVDRWRKLFLGEFTFEDPAQWTSNPSSRPPAWAIMLYLRANAVKAILLRQLYIGQNGSPASRQNILPAIRLISESINMISILDETTDAYRVLHSPFEHFLSATCALFFLVIVFIEHHQDEVSSSLPDGFAGTVRDNFWKALRLAAGYSRSFTSSRRLWKRLTTMRGTLETLGILDKEPPPPPSAPQTSAMPATETPAIPSEQMPQQQQHYFSHPQPAPSTTAGAVPMDWNQITASNAMMMPPMGAMPGMENISAYDVFYHPNSSDSSSGDLGLDFFAMDGNAPYQSFRYP